MVCFLALPTFAQSTEDVDWVFSEYDDGTSALPDGLAEVTTPTVKVSPNPISNQVMQIWYNQVREVSEIAVYNTLGQLFHAFRVGGEKAEFGKKELATNTLAPGIYFVKLKSGAYESVEKIVIR